MTTEVAADFDTLASALKALGDPTRLKIVALLNLREFCNCELVPVFGISQPAISKHLARLKHVGLVRETRKGMWVHYSLNKQRLAEIGLSLTNLPDLSSELQHLEQQGITVKCE